MLSVLINQWSVGNFFYTASPFFLYPRIEMKRNDVKRNYCAISV